MAKWYTALTFYSARDFISKTLNAILLYMWETLNDALGSLINA